MEDNKLEKKKILHVVSEERAYNYTWDKNSHRLNKNLGIVSLEDIQEMKNRDIQFLSPPEEGMVFSLHPYKPNCYMRIDKAEDSLIRYKLEYMFGVLRHLGVKHICANVLFSEEKRRSMDASGGISYKVVSASAGYKEESKEKYAKKYDREETYTGDFTIENYNTAKEIAKNSGIYCEEIEYLIRQRDPGQTNPITEQEIKMELTNEVNDLTEIAFSLNVCGGLFSLNAGIKESISCKKTIMLRTKFTFADHNPAKISLPGHQETHHDLIN